MVPVPQSPLILRQGIVLDWTVVESPISAVKLHETTARPRDAGSPQRAPHAVAFASFQEGNSRAIRTARSKLWTLISSTFTPRGTGWREPAFASRILAQIRRATSNDARPTSRPRWARSASPVPGVLVAPT